MAVARSLGAGGGGGLEEVWLVDYSLKGKESDFPLPQLRLRWGGGGRGMPEGSERDKKYSGRGEEPESGLFFGFLRSRGKKVGVPGGNDRVHAAHVDLGFCQEDMVFQVFSAK